MGDVVDRVVEAFRDAALGLIDWDRALSVVAAATGAHKGQLAGMVSDTGLAINFVHGDQAGELEAYFAAGGDDPAINPRTASLLRARPGECLVDAHMLGAAPRTAWSIYDGLFQQLDIPHSLQVRLDTRHEMAVGVALLGSRSNGTYAQREIDVLRLAAPGIAGAVQAALALGTMQERTIIETAETLSSGSIFLGRDRSIVSLSAAAERIVRAGRHLTILDNRLVAVDATSDLALDRAFRRASAPNVQQRTLSAAALRADRSPPLHVDLCPVPSRMAGPITQTQALLTMRIPRAPDRAAEGAALYAAFGLTLAEAEVASLLADGLSLQDIADTRGSTLSTARSQLKLVFEKTGTHRQVELILLINRYR